MLSNRCANQKNRFGNQGFTLIELLIAIAVFGVVTTGLYSVYRGMQQTTYNQIDVVDVQQNLRVTMSLLNRDIKMAGLLVPSGTTPVALGSNGSSLNLVTASSSYQFARLRDPVDVPGGAPTTDRVFNISSAEETDLFSDGDTVRLIRPMNGAQPGIADLTIPAGGIDRDDTNANANPTITLRGFANGGVANFLGGDIIALVAAGGPDPSTINWALGGTTLQRTADGGTPQGVATDISALTFDYLLDDNTEADATNLQTDDLEEIVAIRVTLTADAVNQLDGVDRQRSMSSVVRIRN